MNEDELLQDLIIDGMDSANYKHGVLANFRKKKHNNLREINNKNKIRNNESGT